MDPLVQALSTVVREAVRTEVEAVLEDLVEDLRRPRPLLDRGGLAHALDVGTPMIDRLRREGMPTIIVGSVPRWNLQDVLQWLRERQSVELEHAAE
jgi:hypothetical protein